MGRVVREAVTAGDFAADVEVIFDVMGRRVMRRSSRGHSDAVDRDSMGHVRRTRLGEDVEIAHRNDLLGRELARELPGGGRIESAYDRAGRLVRRAAHTAPLRPRVPWEEPPWVGPWPSRLAAERGYVHDNRGAVREILGRRGGTVRLEHDPAERLLAVRPEHGVAEEYRYDNAGNRCTIPGDIEVYRPGGRLVRKGGTTYVWDAAGRLVEKREQDGGTWHYRWNGKDLLERVMAPDGTVVDFAYDPFCRRVRKQVARPPSPGLQPVPIEVTHYVWDGDLLLQTIQERLDVAGDPLVEETTFCFEDGSWAPFAHRKVVFCGEARDDKPWLCYLNNGAGTPEALIQPDGALAGEMVRSAWGKVESILGATTPLGFAGQIADEETGLLYNRFRYYDPGAGIFISPDPLGIGWGVSPYGFVPDPMAWIDPLGLVKTPHMRLGDNLERRFKAELRRQHWDTLPGKVGSNNGVDIVAVQRDAAESIVAMRIYECKANSSRLGASNAGPQMSEPWLTDVLNKMRVKGGCTEKTGDAIDNARQAGALEKYVVRGRQSKPGGRWSIDPPQRIL